MHVINLGHFGKQLSLSKEGQVAVPADTKASWTPFWTKTAVGVRLVDRSRSGGRTSTFAVGVDGGMQRGIGEVPRYGLVRGGVFASTAFKTCVSNGWLVFLLLS